MSTLPEAQAVVVNWTLYCLLLLCHRECELKDEGEEERKEDEEGEPQCEPPRDQHAAVGVKQDRVRAWITPDSPNNPWVASEIVRVMWRGQHRLLSRSGLREVGT